MAVLTIPLNVVAGTEGELPVSGGEVTIERMGDQRMATVPLKINRAHRAHRGVGQRAICGA